MYIDNIMTFYIDMSLTPTGHLKPFMAEWTNLLRDPSYAEPTGAVCMYPEAKLGPYLET